MFLDSILNLFTIQVSPALRAQNDRIEAKLDQLLAENVDCAGPPSVEPKIEEAKRTVSKRTWREPSR